MTCGWIATRSCKSACHGVDWGTWWVAEILSVHGDVEPLGSSTPHLSEAVAIDEARRIAADKGIAIVDVSDAAL